jgi:two-component system cell cycle sensor histidine kinase/response regulator CckA
VTPAKILIVEDEVMLAKELARGVKKSGYDVVGRVTTGEDAVRRAEETQPDLILMDIELEGETDGIEAAKLIRSRIDTAIVYLTADATTEVFGKAKITEPYAFLTKPVSPQELRRTVETALYKRQMDRRLKQSERRYRELVANLNDVIFSTDAEGRINYVSPPVERVLGWKIEELVGRRFHSLVHPNDLSNVEKSFQDVLKNRLCPSEFRILGKSGDYRWLRTSSRPILEGDKPVGITGVATDITERKETEKELKASQEALDMALSAARVGTWDYDIPSGRVILDHRFMDLLGFAREELEPSFDQWFGLIHPDDRAAVMEAVQNHLQGRTPAYSKEYRMRTKSGDWIWVLAHAKVVETGADGKPIRGPGIIVDITERKKAEEELKESEAQKQAILDGLTTNMAFVNEDLEILWVNKTAAESVEKSPQEMLGHKCHEFWADLEAPCENCPTVKAFKTKKSEHVEIVTPDGRVWDEKGEPVFDDEGTLLGVIEIAQDITDRRLAEAALIESEERYRRIVETANEGIWAMDSEFRTTFVNRKMADMLGYSVEEMLGCRVDFFMFQEDLGDHQSKMEMRQQGGDQIYERRFLPKDGGILWTTVSTTVLKDSEGNFAGSFAMFTDITDRKKMEVMLRESEEQLQAIFRASPAAVFLVNPEGCITFSNQSMGTLFSCESDELLGTPYVELVHPDERNIGYDKMKALMAGQIDHVSLERRYVSKDSGEFLGHLSGRRLLGPDGELTGLVGIITDITDRKKAEEALRESEEHYRNFFENALVGLFRSRLSDGLFIEINSKAAEQQGLPVEEIVGKVRSSDRYRNPDQRNELISKLRRDGEVHDFEADLTLHDGRDVTFSLSVKAYPDKDYMEGAMIDVTDRKKAEDALRKNKALLEAVWRTSPVGIAVARNRVFTWVNKAWAEMHGYRDVQEVVGLSTEVSYASATEFERIGTVFYEALKTQTVAESHAHCRRKDGSLFHGHIRLTLLDPDNPDAGVIGAIIDVTDRKKAEDALKESEEKFRAIFEGAGDGIFGVDTETRKAVVVSPSMCGITGYTQSELLQLRVDDLHPEEQMPHVLEHFFKLLHGEISTAKDVPVIRKNGDVVYCDISVGFSRFCGREVLLGFFRDVTELKLAEQSIRESQRRYRTLFEQSKDAILIVHPEGMIIDANAACWDLFGAARDEIVGANILQFYRNPSDRDRLREGIGRKGFVKDFDWRVKQKTGGERHCLLTSTAWKDGHGTILAHLSIARDITDSKRLEEQLLQSQKMEAVGTLAGGIAHDFNNLLQVIQGYADLGLMDMRRDEPGYSKFLEIRSAARKAADLTQSLLTFSRRVEGQLRPVDLNQELIQISKMLERTIPKMIAIDLEVASDLLVAEVDPGQFQQAVMNLAVNARDAMPEGGRLVIQTANVNLDEEYCKAHIGAEPGTHVMLAVSDTGYGMDKNTRKKIFDPFFTTKEVGKGTGLGLSIVFGIVKSHGGTITCYSEPGEGTTFKIYLPAIKQAQGHEVEVHSERLIGGTETILLVDDEDAVRKLGESILRRFGYTVLTASNGLEALEVFQNQKERIPLVILDLIMPEMGGRECLREIMRIDPAAKVLIASGYGANGQIDGALEDGARTSIRKPYESRQLLEAVRRVLDYKEI